MELAGKGDAHSDNVGLGQRQNFCVKTLAQLYSYFSLDHRIHPTSCVLLSRQILILLEMLYITAQSNRGKIVMLNLGLLR
jgi:hypothetical protein